MRTPPLAIVARSLLVSLISASLISLPSITIFAQPASTAKSLSAGRSASDARAVRAFETAAKASPDSKRLTTSSLNAVENNRTR